MAYPAFLSLPRDERTAMLTQAGDRSGRRLFLLEKDVWVVQSLEILFGASFGGDMIFKGGTSLSKAWSAIERFSEDVDVTYDIRAFAPDLVGEAGPEALPPSRSQEKKWTRAIRERLAKWVHGEAFGAVESGFRQVGISANVRAGGDCLYIGYEPLFPGYGFIAPEVKLEFGARSTGEPSQRRRVICDAAEFLREVSGCVFPEAHPAAMLAERTFWEKATAAHVYCRMGRLRGGNRFSRHWHDLMRLDDAEVADAAFADRTLALSVARHKGMFFVEKDAAGNKIDYEEAVSGGLQLVPDGEALEGLRRDYEETAESQMLLEDGVLFDEVMGRCADLERRANAAS